MKKLKIKEDTIREVLLSAGFLTFCTGIWLIYPPASLIIGGLLLMWLGFPSKRQKGG
ncbi:hypothetical protein [Paenibacillus sp. NRS-1780]|uniref:hypothetical protein n=1 Tax=Paenibacillus sp. NRS-1780 TaxID=3233904 RepID=UPI003D27EBD8